MGLSNSGDVKNRLKSLKPYKLNNTPKDLPGCTIGKNFLLQNGEKTVIIDISSYLYTLFLNNSNDTWEKVFKSYEAQFNRYLEICPTLKKIIVCIDCPRTVPKNKKITQLERDKTNNNSVELSPTDKSYLKIGTGNVIPPELQIKYRDLESFKNGLLQDRYIKNEIQSWIMIEMIKRRLKRAVWFIVDEVMWKYIKPLDNNNSQRHSNLRLDDFVRFEVYLRPKLSGIKVVTNSNIGEGEIKCFNHLISESLPLFREDITDDDNMQIEEEKNKHSITVISKDTDSLMICLLNMIHLINPDSGMLCQTVYIYDMIEIWNMNILWRSIQDHFYINRDFYKCSTPIETLVFLFILNGSDYTEGIRGIGEKTLWKKYMDDPSFIGTKGNLNHRHDFSNQDGFDIQQYGSNENGFDPVIKISTFIGRSEEFRLAHIDCSRICRFIQILSKGSFNEKDIRFYYGRCVWTLGYWSNPNFGAADPFELYGREPRFGWTKNEKNEVCLAGSCSRGLMNPL